MTYDQRVRILRDVILGVEPPADESNEAKQVRAAFVADKAKADKAGYMLEIPFDWDNNQPN